MRLVRATLIASLAALPLFAARAAGAPKMKPAPAPSPMASAPDGALENIAPPRAAPAKPEVKKDELPPPPVPAPEPATPSAREPLGLRLSPTVGFGNVDEAALSTTNPQFRAGLAVEYAFKEPMAIGLSFSDRFYRRTYMTTQPDLSGSGPALVDQDEQELALDLLFSYDLAKTLGADSGRLVLAPVVGPSFRLFHNEAMRHQAGALAVGARVGWALSESLDVRASGLYGYNLFFRNADLPSALAGPKAVSVVDGSLGLRLAPGTRFGIGYEGEIVTLGASYRLSHGLAFTFDVLL